MNSRERLLASVSHKQPDKVPIDFGSGSSTAISSWAYQRLIEELDVKDKSNKVFDPPQMLSMPCMEVLERFKVDVLSADRDYPCEWKDMIMPDGLKVQVPITFDARIQPNGDMITYNKNGVAVAKMPVGATFFDQITFPYENGYPASFENFDEDLQLSMWNSAPRSPFQYAGRKDFWKDIRQQALKMKEKGYATIIRFGGNYFETAIFTRRCENILMDLYIDKAETRRFFDFLKEKFIEGLDNLIKEVGDVIDVVRLADDMGMSTGPFFSKDIYIEMLQPYHKALNEYIHSHSNMKTCLHSCGSVYELMPHIIESGYDIINPVQISAKDMQPEKLKREFGKDISFWGGGIDSSNVLPFGTPEQVREQALRNLEIFSKDGGYVFASVHNILSDVPAKNIIALYDAAAEFNGDK